MILDFQGFKNEKNTFIIKELAAFDGHRIFHNVFKAPFSSELLPPELEKQARWVSNHHHGLKWENGITPYYLVKKILQDITSDTDVIYIKGREKADFIKQFITKQVIELPEHPRLQKNIPKCFYHSLNNCYCALHNVFYLYENFIMQ